MTNDTREFGIVKVKEGVEFTRIAPGGFRLLEAIAWTALNTRIDLTITSACDGAHSGPDDPHHRGEAYDLRSHDMLPHQKQDVLQTLGAALEANRFYCFLEAEGTPNEHFHLQVKKGTTYP